MKSFDAQNLWLCNLMEKSMPNQKMEHVKMKNRESSWKYYLAFKGVRKQVCFNFLINLLQISEGRVRRVQKKIMKGESVHDKSGRCESKNKILQEKWDFLHSMLNEMKTTSSHYKIKSSTLKYFEDINLNMKKLFHMFAQSYKEKTNNDSAYKDQRELLLSAINER